VRREILYSEDAGEAWAAVVEDGEVVEAAVEREGPDPIAGDIFSGLVRRVLPGMQAAFVDIGAEKAVFVHAADVPSGIAPDAPLAGGTRRISDLLREGQRILVQITKEALPDKGARATLHVSLPGRLLVHLPTVSQVALSRRIEDPAQRDCLTELMARVARAGEGWIVRTAGADAAEGDIAAEADSLRRLWAVIARAERELRGPARIHREEEVLGRLLRDLANESLAAVIADGEAAWAHARSRIEALAPAALSKLARHSGPRGTLMEYRQVHAVVDRALRPKIRLPSGGTIVISQTEALVAVDVNTARFVGASTQEETALATDLEAAREIARQIRLRNLGGIIVIDFIDLQEEESRRSVMAALTSELGRDRSRSRILDMSSFGLVQITRRRGSLSLDRVLMEDCPCCRGRGRVRSPQTLAHDIRSALGARPEAERRGGWIVRLNPGVASRLKEEAIRLPGDETHGRVRIIPDQGLPPSRFSIEPAEDDSAGS